MAARILHVSGGVPLLSVHNRSCFFALVGKKAFGRVAVQRGTDTTVPARLGPRPGRGSRRPHMQLAGAGAENLGETEKAADAPNTGFKVPGW